MAPLRRTHLFYLKIILRRDAKFPYYHKLAKELAEKGYVRLSEPDDLGECCVSITSKGLHALETASPRPYPPDQV
jgi:hypothetical protein